MMIHTLALQEMTGFYYPPPLPPRDIFLINIFGPSDHSEVPLTLEPRETLKPS